MSKTIGIRSGGVTMRRLAELSERRKLYTAGDLVGQACPCPVCGSFPERRAAHTPRKSPQGQLSLFAPPHR